MGLAVAVITPHVWSSEAPKLAVSISSGAGFPNLPHSSRWIGTTDRSTPGKGGKTPLRYNPPCTEPDQPCNGDPWNGNPRDAFNNDGWTEVLDTQVGGATNSLERVTVYGTSNGGSWPNAVCISSECRIYDLPLIDVAQQSSEPVSEVIFEFLRTRPVAKTRVCRDPRAAAYLHVTSDTGDRGLLARGLYMTMYPNTLLTNRINFEVTWSDGTLEMFQGNTYGPFFTKSTQEGTGVAGSDCR